MFEESIKSKNTLKLYLHHLNKFKDYNSIKDYDKLLAIPKEKLQVMLEDYLIYLKKHLSPNTIPVAMAPLELFFTVNDKDLNFKKLHKMYPQQVKKTGNKSWTTADIQEMLRNTTKKRTRSLILFLSSTGARIGVVEELKLKNLVEMSDKCKAVQFYEGSNEEYWGFLTPEASKALDEYFVERRKDNEKMDENSPIFREGYQVGSTLAYNISKKMAQMTIAQCIRNSSITRTKSGKRYDVQAAHGFRKRFNTILKLNSSVNHNIAEKLMGHKNGLDGVYLTPTREECFTEFKKAITDLTIDDSARLLARNEILEQEKTELEKSRMAIEKLEKKQQDQEDVILRIAKKYRDVVKIPCNSDIDEKSDSL
jgi:integrase/recombinase XerD